MRPRRRRDIGLSGSAVVPLKKKMVWPGGTMRCARQA